MRQDEGPPTPRPIGDAVPDDNPERRLLYEQFFNAKRGQITYKAAKLILKHDDLRRRGSQALQDDVTSLVAEGFVRVCRDPKQRTTDLQFMFGMFRQMENYLKLQRSLTASDGSRNARLDEPGGEGLAGILEFPDKRHDEAVAEQHALDRAREAVERRKPSYLQLFDLSRQNLSIEETAEALGKSEKQVTDARYRLHTFLTEYFQSGEQL